MTDGFKDLTRSALEMPVFGPSIELTGRTGGNPLFLHTEISDYPDGTRSTMVNSDDEMYDKFYVSAYQYSDSWNDDHMKEAPNYFQMDIARKSGSSYNVVPVRYWPSSGKMRFLAHAPVDDTAFTFYPQDDADRGARVHINVSDDIAKQNDLLVAYTSEMDAAGTNTPVSMNFKHALTGIRFECAKSMPKGIITNITIKGVRYEGDFFYNMQSGTQSTSPDLDISGNYNAWETYDKVFSIDMNHRYTGDGTSQINDGENTFLMFPQTLPAGATVEITLQLTDSDGNPTGTVDHLSGDLSGRVWPAGKIVTYKISGSGQVLDVTDPSTFNYLGSVYNTASDSFLSYNPVRVASSAGEKNMKWKVEYMDDDATGWSGSSSWLEIDPSWTWQDTPEQDVKFIAKSAYNSIDIDANLKKAPSKGSSASPYNLANASGASGVENTANCYIVDAAGYYMLPLVYGNAIENSADNTKAYQYSGAAGSSILSTFENHLGNGITSPYIADNSGCNPDHASIVWQDAENLVTEVKYVASAYGGKGGISFYVNPANIKQGNAVIAINDKDNVMWSWHIWATNFSGFDNTVDITNQDGLSFTLMPLNLGWCSNGEAIRYYPQRTCKVRFSPTDGDTSLSQEVTFVKETNTLIPFGNNPYYQWGRKDPFVGTNIPWGNKERWDGTGKYYGTGSENNPPRLFSDLVEDTSSDRLTTKQCLDLLIKNPEKWHNPPAKQGGTSYISENEIYTNLWGDNTIGDEKTVYDPCPPGYQVNYYYTYTGFLSSSFDWTSDKGINFVQETAPDWDNAKLAEFYTDSSKLHSITFPVCGYRDWNDKAEVVDFTLRGFVWMRGCANTTESYMFRYAPHIVGSANVAPVTMFYATDGLPIRPALIK